MFDTLKYASFSLILTVAACTDDGGTETGDAADAAETAADTSDTSAESGESGSEESTGEESTGEESTGEESTGEEGESTSGEESTGEEGESTTDEGSTGEEGESTGEEGESTGEEGESTNGEPDPSACDDYWNGLCGICVNNHCGPEVDATEAVPGNACCYAKCIYEDFWGWENAEICLIECGFESPVPEGDALAACVDDNCANDCPF